MALYPKVENLTQIISSDIQGVWWVNEIKINFEIVEKSSCSLYKGVDLKKETVKTLTNKKNWDIHRRVWSFSRYEGVRNQCISQQR